MTDEGRRLTRRHLLIALCACVALGVTIAGRLTACAGCDYDVFGIPLFAAGSVYYLALGVLAVLGAKPRLIGWIALPGVLVQAGLVRFLLMAGAPCVTCLAAAGSLFALSVAALWPEGKWRLAPGIAALVGIVALPFWAGLLVETERVPGLPSFARATDLRDAPAEIPLLVVYEKQGCSFCASFRNEYEPRLRAEFGPGLSVRTVDSRERKGLRRLPTFLIRRPDGTFMVIRGLPSYESLAGQLRSPG